MAKPRNPYKKVTVEWVDATSNVCWEDIETVLDEKPHKIETTGYLLKEDEDCIIVALTMSLDKDDGKWKINGWFCIPKPWIVRQRGIHIPRKVKREEQASNSVSEEAAR